MKRDCQGCRMWNFYKFFKIREDHTRTLSLVGILFTFIIITTGVYSRAEEPKPVDQNETYYLPQSVSAEYQSVLRRELPAKLEKMKITLGQYRDQSSNILGDSKSLQKNRVESRLAIAGTLLEFAEKNLNKSESDLTSLMLADNALFDFKLFTQYFDEEFKCWKILSSCKDKDTLIINIRDFGAKGDGISDDSKAFIKAVDKLKSLQGAPAILRIPQGQYLLNEEQLSTAFTDQFTGWQNKSGAFKGHWVIADLTNATIEGETPDTEIIFGQAELHGFYLVNGQNVTIRNLSFKFKENPFSQGTIIKNLPDEKAVIFKHDKNTFAPDDPRYNKTHLYTPCCSCYTEDGNIVLNASHFFYSRNLKNWQMGHISSLSPGIFRIN